MIKNKKTLPIILAFVFIFSLAGRNINKTYASEPVKVQITVIESNGKIQKAIRKDCTNKLEKLYENKYNEKNTDKLIWNMFAIGYSIVIVILLVACALMWTKCIRMDNE